jgi:signal transduction histidine kinase
VGQFATIKSKLVIGFFSIASFVVIVGTVGFVNSLHINSAFNVVTNDTLPELLVLDNIQSSINKISSDIVGFALGSSAAKALHQERLQQMIQDNKTLTTYIDQFGTIAQPTEMPSYRLLKYLTLAYSTVSLQLINSKANGMDEQAILNMIRSTDDIRSQINVVSNNLRNVEKAGLQMEIGKANDAIRTQQIELIFSSIGAFMVSLVIGRHISQYSIIKPLSRLKDAASQIASGNLDFEMKSYAQPDEIGELSAQFDSMRQMLNQRTRELETSNTQLSLANVQLKEHDKVQRDFINIAAHELRTPIQPLLLASAELKHLMPNEETVLVVCRNAKKLQDLANVILDAARIESNTIQIYKESVNLKNIIQDALKEIEGPHNDRLEVMYEPRDIFIVADKDRITQVIFNLMSNALKFTKKGKIFVIVKENNINEQVIVSIKDTGDGIDREMISRLFTRFATKSFDGTGLGLYISRSIIEAHGGTIWAEDNDDGTKGATFSFSLPKLSSYKRR